MKQKIALLVLLSIVMIFAGCKAQQRKEIKIPAAYDKPLGPGEVALRKITNPLDIPDFTVACYNLTDLKDAVDNSLNYLGKRSSERFFPSCDITHRMAVESLKEFAKLLNSGLTGRQLNDAIKEKFDVYMSVGCDGNGTVLFTGYYTPIFKGSAVKTERFKYPLYRKPKDLIKDEDGKTLGREGAGGALSPYPPREIIENSGMLEGQELIWLEDAFEAYIASVQGSAKIQMPEGKLITAAYSANNGHEYKSVSKEMLKDGAISKKQMSLSAMVEYFKMYPEQVTRYVNKNPRYVFFKEDEGQPRGSLNEPVVKMRTIATDKSIFPRGSLTFLSTTLPQVKNGAVTNQYYSGFATDQDTGGAIKAAGRCDVYMGQGDEAGKLAGQVYQEGKLYYLFLKQPDLIRQY